MAEDRYFIHRKHFPGTLGNPFDVILKSVEKLEKIPSLLFAGLLLIIAIPPTWKNLINTAGLWAFFLLDWLILALLPHFNKSYGPAKPPTVALAILRTFFTILPFPISAIAQVIGTCILIYGLWIEPHQIHVTYQKLTTDKFFPNKSMHLLHIGDLHLERITKRERQLISLIDSLNPDIILFSGDILNLSYLNDKQAKEAAQTILSQFHAPLGVFLVSGSPAVDLPEILPEILKDLPLCWLQDEKTTVAFQENNFEIIGINCTHRPSVDGPKLESTVDKNSQNFTILLYHTPDLAPIASKLGIDLQLSGHTHGGQVRFPLFGALFTGSLYGKRFEAARYALGDMILYVTRGLGMEGAGAPRIRFLCPPEIIMWDISGPSQEITSE